MRISDWSSDVCSSDLAPPTLDPNSVPAATTPAVPAPAAAAASEAAPAVYGDPGAMARTADERGDYEVAFNALKAGQYAESAQLFQDFLRAHPSGAYAPNAYYWLGESYYRSEEHTSELQSLMRSSYAVFCLKKKK